MASASKAFCHTFVSRAVPSVSLLHWYFRSTLACSKLCRPQCSSSSQASPSWRSRLQKRSSRVRRMSRSSTTPSALFPEEGRLRTRSTASSTSTATAPLAPPTANLPATTMGFCTGIPRLVGPTTKSHKVRPDVETGYRAGGQAGTRRR